MDDYNIISINFREHQFKTTKSTIYSKGENPLTIMIECESKETDSFFVDKDGKYFGKVLSYLSDNKIPTALSLSEKEDIEYIFLWLGIKINVRKDYNFLPCSTYKCENQIIMTCVKCGQYLCNECSAMHYFNIIKYNTVQKYRCNGNNCSNQCENAKCIIFAEDKCPSCKNLFCRDHFGLGRCYTCKRIN